MFLYLVLFLWCRIIESFEFLVSEFAQDVLMNDTIVVMESGITLVAENVSKLTNFLPHYLFSICTLQFCLQVPIDTLQELGRTVSFSNDGKVHFLIEKVAMKIS